jgi:uncharacterized protein YpbB
MFQQDNNNIFFKLAGDFINKTSRHIFLTGKAGTGKTTFLKYIKEQATKKAIVVAPTGVAAINAGGVTMHSFFQLPFGPFVPGNHNGFTIGDGPINRHSLFKHIRFNAGKRELLQELELLIIDEVSMVRCDMLDAMDIILRYFRHKPSLPFGGVQVLLIGDLYQLPPVMPENEWALLKEYYQSPFFFSARVMTEAPPLYIELKKIYRQNEQPFIDLLNRVRNNLVSAADLQQLNSRYQPDFSPPASEQYITLCTHNRRADAINMAAIEQLPGKLHRFAGSIEGDFPDHSLPTDKTLLLKEGAQVMFIKNDSGNDRKYYNGKLAIVKKITEDAITVVSGKEDSTELTVSKETWRNIRYALNKEKNYIEEEELGSFTQYPLRLAWAITIHKSQGLTFEKAVIDAGAAFAAGQVYVALSRCTAFSGIVLRSKLSPPAISTDERVKTFSENEIAAGELQQLLNKEQRRYQASKLIALFDWSKTISQLKDFEEMVPGKKLPDNHAVLELARNLHGKAVEQSVIAARFQQQLETLLENCSNKEGLHLLEERMSKSVSYFSAAIANDLLHPLQQHIDSLKSASKVRQYIIILKAIESLLWTQLQSISSASYGDITFNKEGGKYQFLRPEAATTTRAERAEKPEKGSSQQESLRLFKEGKTIPEIAAIRNLAESTIGGHLAMFVREGKLDVYCLVNEEKLSRILPVVKEVGGHAITPIREKLGEDYSFAEIRAVLNYWHWQNEEKENA